jgi:hypothetical protein
MPGMAAYSAAPGKPIVPAEKFAIGSAATSLPARLSARIPDPGTGFLWTFETDPEGGWGRRAASFSPSAFRIRTERELVAVRSVVHRGFDSLPL